MSYFSNAFANEDYQLIQPRRKILPKLPAMDVYDPTTIELKQVGNFMAEFSKWVPSLEMLYCTGDMDPGEDAEGVSIWSNNYDDELTETVVSQEWYDAFVEYEVEEGEMDDVFYLYTEDYGDGGWENFRPHNNIEAIAQYEEVQFSQGVTVDAFQGGFHNSFVHGIRHHTSDWGPGATSNEDVWAGKGSLEYLTNIDFDPSVSDWNHIYMPDTEQPLYDVDQAYFIQEDLETLGLDWPGLNDWAATKFGDMNFYDVVMTYYSKSHLDGGTTLDAEESIKFMLLLKESKYRLWSALETVTGDLADTRSESDIMDTVSDFCDRNKPMLNFMSISLFLNIYRVQHNTTNFMIGFWLGEGGIDEGEKDTRRRGHSQSVLDNYRFWNFAKDLGARGFKWWLTEEKNYEFNEDWTGNDLGVDVSYDDDEMDLDDLQSGKLYDYRASFSGLADLEAYDEAIEERGQAAEDEDWETYDEKNAQIEKFDYVNGLIEDHFGSYYPGYEPEYSPNSWDEISWRPTSSDIVDYGINDDDKIAPLYADYNNAPTEDTPGSWHGIPGGIDMSDYGDAEYVFVPDTDYPSLSFDRKFNENYLAVSSNGDWSDAESVPFGSAEGRELHNAISSSYINELPSGTSSHSNYNSFQTNGLNTTYMTTGWDFNNNYVVHTAGELYRNGLGKGYEKIVWKWIETRKNSKQYDDDCEEYDEAKERISFEKIIEARQRAKRQEQERWVARAEARRRGERKELTKEAQARAIQRSRAQRENQQRLSEKRAQEKAAARKRK